MTHIRDGLMKVALFTLVFLSWMWVVAQPFSAAVNLSVIVGGVLLVFPVVWFGRLLLDRDPEPEDAAWITTLMHALLMVLFGAAVIRALMTYETWNGQAIPIPPWIGLALLILTGVPAVLAVINLAVRGLGAPFGLALTQRLASDWMYAWTRNPMVLATLAFLVSLGLWFQSTLFVVWVCLLVIPALLFFVKVFEERELEIRFGESYAAYKARTPMLVPRRPRAEPAPLRRAAPKRQPKPKAKRRTAGKRAKK